mgnify:FL=1
MPKQEGQKSKLLALLRIFEQQTDENHLLNVPQLVELLEAQGIRCERKSVYSDIEALGALGYDIKLRRAGAAGISLPAAPLIWRSSSCWWMPCRQAGWYPAPRAGG